MRNLIKKMAHGIIALMERVFDFYIPQELPLRQKLAFLFGFYENETSKFIRKNVYGGVAFDVGAHIGYYSRLLSSVADRVYAFEPEPRNFALLVKNTRKYPNVTPVNMAISNKSGQEDFFIVKGSTFRHSLVDEGDCESVQINTTSLDDFVKENSLQGISFVKIDVEGHEKEVLEGMKEIINKHHPIVIAEMPENENHHPVSPKIGRQGRLRNYRI